MDHRHLTNGINRRRKCEARNSNLLTILRHKANNSDGALARKLNRPFHRARDAAKPKVEGAEALVGRSHGEGSSPSSELYVSGCDELIWRRVSCQSADADRYRDAKGVGDVPGLVAETEVGVFDRNGNNSSC